ncbi:MAG: TolC family protein [Myxococcales bacterium]|nr:TolC family protein [Myxococcales bacterium]
MAYGPTVAAHGAEVLSEEALIRGLLTGAVASSEREASAARAASHLAPSPVQADVAARHEEARGPAGATTRVVGASVTVDLGLSPLWEGRAARLRGRGGEHELRAVALQSVCELRRGAVELWAADASQVAGAHAQRRLDALLAAVTGLAGAGEASGHARDRTALSVAVHRVVVAEQGGALAAWRARVEALVGRPVPGVELWPVPPLPTLEETSAALADHPELEALRAYRDAEARAVTAARADQLPDLTVWAGRRWDAPPAGGQATPGFEIGGTLGVPWTDGGRATRRRSAADQASAQARLVRAEAERMAAAVGAWERADRLRRIDLGDAPDPDALWGAAMERYAAGEASLDELLQTAAAVEQGALSRVAHERLERLAHLDLTCATGRLSPRVEALLEEVSR